jgi:hypothetical protein
MGANRVNFPRVIAQNPHSHGGCISLILRGGKSRLEPAQNQMFVGTLHKHTEDLIQKKSSRGTSYDISTKSIPAHWAKP